MNDSKNYNDISKQLKYTKNLTLSTFVNGVGEIKLEIKDDKIKQINEDNNNK